MATEKSHEDVNVEVDDDFARSMLEDLMQTPSQYDRATYEKIEERFEGTRVSRRVALLILTQPFNQLRDRVVANRRLAEAMVEMSYAVDSTLDMMRDIVEILETSRTWQMMALACRDDMMSLFEEAQLKRVARAEGPD